MGIPASTLLIGCRKPLREYTIGQRIESSPLEPGQTRIWQDMAVDVDLSQVEDGDYVVQFVLGEQRGRSMKELFLVEYKDTFSKRSQTQNQSPTRQEAVLDEPTRDYLDRAYQAQKSDFALGYLMAGVANAALGRHDEAEERYGEAVQANVALAPVVERLRARNFNALLVIEHGLGPEKIAYGMDNVFTRFAPRRGWESGGGQLQVSISGDAAGSFPFACDLNRMATRHRWNNFEDVRVAKSYLGTALVTAGAATTALFDDRTTQSIGLGVMLIGTIVKASAKADTRYCIILPQRVYFIPVTILEPDSTIVVQVGGNRSARMVLTGVDPPQPPEQIRVCYGRLVPDKRPPKWATASNVIYANDHYEGRVLGDGLPYILGGRCVSTPSSETLRRYQQAGFLAGFTVAQLEELYRAEKIALSLEEQGGHAGMHVLEGGNSLACPLPGSAGYQRLFCQEHRKYRARSGLVRKVKVQYRKQIGEYQKTLKR